MKKEIRYNEQLVFLRKIEGQIRGIQRMIEQKRDGVDIITQLHSAIGAITSVEDNIFKKHIQLRLKRTLKNRSELEQAKAVEETVKLLRKFKRNY